ncbi:MAG TPA: penicillin-binding protein 2 [Gammaproteobacteria bacterium]|nr:penicillin-binding protein 2 [Gammaproteobacteria bacterium]
MPVLFKLKDHFKENQLYINRSIAALIVVGMLLALLLGRLFYLQIYHHATYVTLARNNQVRMISIAPTRGIIFDRNGEVLADNIPDFSLEISPNMVKDIDGLIETLSTIVNISETDIKNFHKQRKYKGRFERIPIRNKLTEKEVAAFSIQKYKFPECDIHANLARYYPHGEAFAHVLGYTGIMSEQDLDEIDQTKYRGTYVIGKYGIEKSYEETLRGTAGYEQVETDARGRKIRNLEEIPPIAGQNIYLSIDSKLQMVAYDALQNFHGAVVAMDIKTGGILALVSKPSFDPNLFVKGIPQEVYTKLQHSKDRPLFNRAIRGQYSPGSTVKPIIALQALDLNIVTPKTIFNDKGYYQLHADGRKYRDWKEEGHGLITVTQALTESSSPFFYFIGDKMGIDKLHDIFVRFGLGTATNIDIEGEATGIAPSPAWKKKTRRQSWFPGETLSTAIGQGYTLVTPVQLACLAASIGTRGQRIQPTLVKATQIGDQALVEKEVKALTPVKIKHEEYWDVVIGAMENVVKSQQGTAYWVNAPRAKFTMAGKTGTVQVFGIKQDEKYEADKVKAHLRDHKWFIAFAPIEDPQIAIAVIIEHNPGSPMVARKVLEAYFAEKSNGQ